MKKFGTLLLTLFLITTVGCSKNTSTINTPESTNTQAVANNTEKQQPDNLSAYKTTKLVLKSRDEVTNIVKDTFVSSYDEVNDSSIFYPDSNNANIQTYVTPLIGFDNHDGDAGFVIFRYVGKELTMFDTIIIKTDSDRYEKYFDFDSVKRNVEWGYNEEYATMVMDKDLYKMVEDMVNSTKTIVRFSGDTYEDYELSNRNKEDLKKLLDCYTFE